MGVVLAGMLLGRSDRRRALSRLHAQELRLRIRPPGLTSASRQPSSASQRNGFRQLLDIRALDDCGAIGAALVKAYAKKQDPRYRTAIDAIADYIAHKQMRMPDGTLAGRARCRCRSG